MTKGMEALREKYGQEAVLRTEESIRSFFPETETL
jgi:hypothetical protein